MVSEYGARWVILAARFAFARVVRPMPSGRLKVPAPIVAVISWLVPGAGYLLLGQVARGLTIGITILLLFVAGLLIGGVHVVDPPTFIRGHNVFNALLQKPWYIGQFFSGAVGLISGWIGPSQPASHARVADIATLYTAVAGMLNLMAIIDCSYRASVAEDDGKGT